MQPRPQPGHAEHLVDRHDARATDPGEEHVARRRRTYHRGGHGRWSRHGPSRIRGVVGQFDRDERRAVAVEAAVVGVAAGLVDAGLAAELGLYGLHRQAVALDAAVTAALTHGLVDDDAGAAHRELAAFALTTRVGRALLVVDQHRDAFDVAQHALGLVEPITVPQQGSRGQAVHGVARRVVGAHHDLADALGGQLVGELGNAQCALGVLGTGHRDRGVVQQLVGDVDPGGHAGLDRQLPGVEIGSVTDVLEDVLDVGERGLADPLCAFATHLRQPGDRGFGARRHRHQGVAADAASRQRALGHHGRAVVRATRAEERGTRRAQRRQLEPRRRGRLYRNPRPQHAVERREQTRRGQLSVGGD